MAFIDKSYNLLMNTYISPPDAFSKCSKPEARNSAREEHVIFHVLMRLRYDKCSNVTTLKGINFVLSACVAIGKLAPA